MLSLPRGGYPGQFVLPQRFEMPQLVTTSWRSWGRGLEGFISGGAAMTEFGGGNLVE